MRKIVLTLTVVLLAVPAMADVKLIAELDAGNPKKVWIKYESDEAQNVRAFALNITATDGNIIDINDYSVGDNNGGYGIFPGAFAAAPIAVNPTTGQVDNWNITGYSPLAPAGDPEAAGDLGSSAITIECGSLYTDSGPSQTDGYLCSVTVDDTASEVCITGNAIRGNVVLEDASEATMDLVEACVIIVSDVECIASDDPVYADWDAFDKPDCWCYARQCYGDADGLKQGSIITGYMYVSTNDLIALSDAWQIKEPPKGPGIASLEGGICADFDHAQQGSIITGYMRVSTNDLIALSNNWQIKEPPKGDGIPGDCVAEPIEP
jgi:hypothetical protein